MKRSLFLQLAMVFLLTQLLGIYVADYLSRNNMAMEMPAEGKGDVANSFYMFAYILVFTGILLVIIKLLKGKLLYYLLKTMESLAVFGSAVIVFGAFYDDVIVVLPALALVVGRIIFPKKISLRNFATILAVSGTGAIIGVSLGTLPIAVFMVLLAAYDYVAVFKTKHMVTLAKAVTAENLAFSYAMPTPEHKYELGTGDLVIPLAFAAAVLADAKTLYPFPNYYLFGAAILSASIIGLKLTMDVVEKKPGNALPALPLQVALMAFAYLLMIGTGILPL